MKLQSLTAVAAALAITAGSADAQLISFTTSGLFSGAGCSATVLTASYASCSASGGIDIRYTFGTEEVLDTFGTAQFGFFTTSGMGPSTFEDVMFAMTVNQSTPSSGDETVSADVYGTVSAIQGGLIWGPITETMFSIGAVTYNISVDLLTNGVRIDPPGIDGATSDMQTIRGFVESAEAIEVPEPNALALLAVGLVGLGVAVRRRQSA